MTNSLLLACTLAAALALGLPSALRADALDDDLAAAKALLVAGKDDEAADRLDALEARARTTAAASPSDAHAQYILGMAAMYAGHDGPSQSALERAIRLAPENALYVQGRAQLFIYQARPQDAIPLLEKFVQQNDKSLDTWDLLGEAQAGAAKFAAAQESYQKAFALAPRETKYLIKIGQMQSKQQSYADALTTFQKALELDAKSTSALANIAQVYEAQKNLDQALATYAKLVALNPADYRALSKQVQLYQAQGKTKERDAARDQILALKKDGKIDAAFFCREQYAQNKSQVIVLEYFDGPRAVRYAFNLVGADGKSVDKRITLGSYLENTALARETGQITTNERLFHLDVYIDGGGEEHQLLRSFTKEPTYEETRDLVNQYLAGTLKPLPPATKPATRPAAQPAGGR